MHYLQLIFLLKSTLTFSAPSKIKVNWKILHINARTSWCRGGGIFCDQIFFSQKVKVSPGTHLNTRKYSFCGIKLETKVINLHKIEVVQISSFLLNKCAVHNF